MLGDLWAQLVFLGNFSEDDAVILIMRAAAVHSFTYVKSGSLTVNLSWSHASEVAADIGQKSYFIPCTWNFIKPVKIYSDSAKRYISGKLSVQGLFLLNFPSLTGTSILRWNIGKGQVCGTSSLAYIQALAKTLTLYLENDPDLLLMSEQQAHVLWVHT